MSVCGVGRKPERRSMIFPGERSGKTSARTWMPPINSKQSGDTCCRNAPDWFVDEDRPEVGGEAATKDDVAEAIEGIAEVRDGLIRVLVSISGLQSAGLKPAVSPTMTL